MPNQPNLNSLMAFLSGDTGAISMRDLMSHNYPTAEEIMADPPKHKPAVITFLKEWKRTAWKDARAAGLASSKYGALEILIQGIATIYRRPVEVAYNPSQPSACYINGMNRIILNERLSVITALHELSHHLFGRSEKKACRWSVHLFKKAFPRAFSQLEWRGHTLVKRNNLIEQPAATAPAEPCSS